MNTTSNYPPPLFCSYLCPRTYIVLIAAHGGGESNMLFMPPGGAVIEVRPDNWPMPCFIDLADNVGLQVTT